MELPKSEKGFALIIIIILIIIGSIVAYLVFQKSSLTQSLTSSKQSSGSTESLFGTMASFNIIDAANKTPGTTDALSKGWTKFKEDGSAYQNLKSNLEKLIQDHTKLVKATGFSIDRTLAPYFTWNVIEPQKGQFDWDLTDIYVKGTTNAGIKISAAIQPYAAWDQQNTQVNANCKMLDAAFFDYKIGPPNDISEYENFLTKTVERYKNSVAVWEIGNENDGPCGGYEDNPQGYFNLLKISSETIKKADPNAKVVNGADAGGPSLGPGAGSVENFWQQFFALGGSKYIDYFNFHYNTERGQNAKLDPTVFQKDLTSINGLMGENDGRKPLYLTEFGVYSGSPSSQPGGQAPHEQTADQPTSSLAPFVPPAGQPRQGQSPVTNHGVSSPSLASQNLPEESQEAQAALYFKNSILAFANGVKTVFIDLIGPNDGLVGSSMAFSTDNQPRLFLTTLKMIDSKIDGFTGVEKITDGQYKFTVNGKTVYALWSGTLPNEISGKVKVTDIKGQEQTADATAVKLRTDQPIFLEFQK